MMLLRRGMSGAFCRRVAPGFRECRVATLQRFANPAQLQEFLPLPDVHLSRNLGNGLQASEFRVSDGSSIYRETQQA
jgi:hypothetical protein